MREIKGDGGDGGDGENLQVFPLVPIPHSPIPYSPLPNPFLSMHEYFNIIFLTFQFKKFVTKTISKQQLSC